LSEVIRCCLYYVLCFVIFRCVLCECVCCMRMCVLCKWVCGCSLTRSKLTQTGQIYVFLTNLARLNPFIIVFDPFMCVLYVVLIMCFMRVLIISNYVFFSIYKHTKYNQIFDPFTNIPSYKWCYTKPMMDA